MSPEQIVAELRRVAESDPDALGFAVVGSRARGLVTPGSDHDCALIVRDGAGDAFRARYAGLPREVDLRIYTLSEFRARAAWGSDTAWDRYTWAAVRIDPDRTGGELQRIADEKGRVPAEAVAPLVYGALDGYLNQVYRSVKCLRAGDREGARRSGRSSRRSSPCTTGARCRSTSTCAGSWSARRSTSSCSAPTT